MRSLDNNKITKQPNRIPTVYITKYNKFVDNIIGRINNILGKNFDPVRVKLISTDQAKKTKTKKSKKNIKKKQKTVEEPAMNKMGEMEISRTIETEAREPAFILISKNGESKESSTGPVLLRAPAHKHKKKNSHKTKSAKKAPKARATLFGLSSIKRDGDVSVNMMANHTTVKTNFLLGPLTLRVEKEFGRGAKREVKSAIATTAEMKGRLNLRIEHGGAATLHSIKVLQPKQVRVDSADNHEKTKEFVWKRSSHIASVVSQKLTSAAKSMLQPVPTILYNSN